MNPVTHDRIIEGAIACLAKNSNAGLEEIAKAAGVGRATLYRYFPSRAELITAMKLQAGERLHKIVEPVMSLDIPAREKLTRIITSLVSMGASLNVSSYFSYPVKENDPRVMASYQLHRNRARELCLAMKQEGAVSSDVPLVWLTASLDALVFEAWAKVEQGEIAPKQAPWLVLETFLAGHGSPDTRAWFQNQKETY